MKRGQLGVYLRYPGGMSTLNAFGHCTTVGHDQDGERVASCDCGWRVVSGDDSDLTAHLREAARLYYAAR